MLTFLILTLAAHADLTLPHARDYVHLRFEPRLSRDIGPRPGALPAFEAARDVELDLYFKPGAVEAPPILRARYKVALEGGGSEWIDSGLRPARYQTTEAHAASVRATMAQLALYMDVHGQDEPPFLEEGLTATVTGTSAKSGLDLEGAVKHVLLHPTFEVNEITVVLPLLMYSGHVPDVHESEFRLKHVFENPQRTFQLRRQYTAVARRVPLTAGETAMLQQVLGLLCGTALETGRLN